MLSIYPAQTAIRKVLITMPLACCHPVALRSLAVSLVSFLYTYSSLGAVAGVEHVVVVGVDGLSGEGVRKSRTPHLTKLMRTGAWTLQARAVRIRDVVNAPAEAVDFEHRVALLARQDPHRRIERAARGALG